MPLPYILSELSWVADIRLSKMNTICTSSSSTQLAGSSSHIVRTFSATFLSYILSDTISENCISSVYLYFCILTRCRICAWTFPRMDSTKGQQIPQRYGAVLRGGCGAHLRVPTQQKHCLQRFEAREFVAGRARAFEGLRFRFRQDSRTRHQVGHRARKNCLHPVTLHACRTMR
jgi:hypothetical protein